ncbi:MAG: beta-galactosidase [Muribaculaceae bacterium]
MKKRLVLLMLLLANVISLSANESKETFRVGDNQFLLNEKPFVIKAAEIHYPRVPREYWEHRIKMCKSLGMNTICLYVFWNLHEQEPNSFDFSGNNDIGAFCKLAQKHGMYVIVRPGPYVCAEWEMGGLPWWLLKDNDIKLRTLDEHFINRVEIFMKELGNKLKSSLITNGGNIIMVQVENEYGSYAIDKPYVSKIRDIVKESGFNNIPLFQCDWNSNFLNNGLDDLIWTINFGTGANIDKQFAKLKEVRPNSPLMCSEYWSGWFDHWGRKHEVRNGNVMVKGIKEMLEKNISFSLYMTHGGTTFGHWGGASNPAYSAMCSSYDYDAPISEAGWATDKYYILRDVMKTFLKAGESLPEVPAQIPVMEISQIRFNNIASVFDNLPKAIKIKDIKPMEYFNQGWGSILYSTKLPKIKKGTLLKITEQHDWTQVFIDKKLIATLDRRKGENEVILPEIKEGSKLDLLVEAMGRVNFDKSIHDRKGITEKVELINSNDVSQLKNWSVYCLPVDYAFVNRAKYITKEENDGPAYYKATFNIDKIADTFLDMRKWGKGMVWVNGHAMGRFWEIGPQQTLYMPGCWLKKGANEIIVLDMKGPKDPVISGLKKPILDMLMVDIPKVHREDGKILSLENEITIFKGEFVLENNWQIVNFNKNISGRYFCIEATSAFDEKNIASIAELDILGKDGNSISRQEWKINYADSEETRSGNYTADKIFDLQESTYWQTVDNSPFPHQLIIDLCKTYEITGFRILPRMEKEVPGMIKSYNIYIKNNEFKIVNQ